MANAIILGISITDRCLNWKFPLLVQLGPTGYILLVPAPISGILGILISRAKKQKGQKV